MNPSTYVGDAAASGRRSAADRYDTLAERLGLGGEVVEDFAGMTGTNEVGICGSFVQDGPTLDSVFFLHRQVAPAISTIDSRRKIGKTFLHISSANLANGMPFTPAWYYVRWKIGKTLMIRNQ